MFQANVLCPSPPGIGLLDRLVTHPPHFLGARSTVQKRASHQTAPWGAVMDTKYSWKPDQAHLTKHANYKAVCCRTHADPFKMGRA